MKITMNNWRVDLGGQRGIGYEQDHLARTLTVDTDLEEAWALKLDLQYPGEHGCEVVDLVRDGTAYSVRLTRGMLRYNGMYVCQLRGLLGETVRHSNTFYLNVDGAINAIFKVPERTPVEMEQMEARITALKEAAEAAADRAENAGGGGPGGTGEDGLSAYEVAVKNGFVGSEAEWLESLKADGDMLKSIYDPQEMDQDIFQYTDGKTDYVDRKISDHCNDMWNPHNVTAKQVGAAAKSASVDATLTADGWTSDRPFVQTIQVPGLGRDQNGYIALSQSATAEQVEAARSAMLSVSGQGVEELTMIADGDRPTVDLPSFVTLLG